MDLTKERRLRWIEQHACQELLQELNSGHLPFRTVLRLAHLPRAQQRRELANRERHIRAQELAADAINQFLAQRDAARRLDLTKLSEAIVDSIRNSPPTQLESRSRALFSRFDSHSQCPVPGRNCP